CQRSDCRAFPTRRSSDLAQSLYAVLRRDPGDGSRKLFGDVFVTVSGATVDRILRESPHEARYFAGFAAWDAGELAREIGEGDWRSEEHTSELQSPDHHVC